MDHLLNYNGKNVFSVHYNPDFDTKTKKSATSVNGTKTKRLMPGNNVVSAEEWGMIKHNPSLEHLFAAGTLSWIGDSPEKEKAEGFNFASLKISDALKIIEQTFDVGLLEKWKASESRAGIVKKISEKIEQIMSYEPTKTSVK